MKNVLIVGGGPVGLTMACALVRYGVECRVIDQNAAPQIWSKAAGVMPRTLEVLRDLGVAEALVERGRPMYGLNAYQGTKRIAHVTLHLEGTPYPFLLGVSQRETELLLAARLEAIGGRFDREVELVSFEQDDGGVRAQLRHASGETEEVRAAYLVGADGAHSTVRRGLGFAFEGSTFEQTLWQADVRVRFPFEADPNEAHAFPSPSGMMGALPLLGEGRYRVIALAPPHPEREPTLEGMQEIARERMPEGVELYDPAWVAGFRFHGRLAERYRDRRVFLAGDAAHIHSPVGAQGMNLGIQDAYNLAWKLALVVHGRGRPILLDSYEPERRRIAAGVVRGTDRATRGAMRALSLRHPIATALRAQLISVVADIGFLQSQLAQTLGGIRVGYPDSPIVGEHHSSIWTTELGTPADERPRLGDWLRFGDGPGPGQRVPDLDLPEGAPFSTLHELLLGIDHVLLLFDGSASTEAGYANLDAIADRVRRRYGDRVRTYVVAPHAERPAALAWTDVLLDPEAEVHGAFGCGSEALYLIRPDGYVGFRSQPAVEPELLRYLETIFVD